MKKVNAIIEKGKDGYCSIYMDYKAEGFGLQGFGDTVEEAQEDFLEGYEEIKELMAEQGKIAEELEFEFKFDTVSFLQYYYDRLSLAALQRMTGIDRHQLSHYVTGRSKPSPKTVAKIQSGITEFANELTRISLI